MGRIGMGIPGIGGMGGGGRRRQGGQGPGSASSYKGTVRWESAKPILEATKSTLPDIFASHYVIAVSGIPLLNPRRGGLRPKTMTAGLPAPSGDSDRTNWMS